MARAEKLNLKRTEDADKVFMIRLLNMVLEQEGNFLASYDIAIRSLTDTDLTDTMKGYRRDHERHVEEIREAVDEFGGEPFEPDEPSNAFRLEERFLEKARGTDEILAYFEVGERQAVWLYDSVRSRPDLPTNVNTILERAFQDEQRHHAWASARVGAGPREREVERSRPSGTERAR